MNLTNLFKIAFKALSNNKLRGFLTMLGIIIGVGSVITMLADRDPNGAFRPRSAKWDRT